MLYKRAFSEQPGDSETIRGLGVTLMKLQSFSSAAKYFALVRFQADASRFSGTDFRLG